MSSSCEHNDLLLMRNGTSQNQRCIDALDPQSIQLHDLNTEDWMRFALRFSEKVNYFNTETNTISGDWSNFFIKENEIADFVEKLKNLEKPSDTSTLEKNIEPHLTLFAAFLKLTSFSQERLNSLSKKHLDFYYKEVLKLDNKAPVEDKVHILFELAKNSTEVRIEEKTSLDGGKDKNGTKRIYKTQEEIIVNKTSVASLRNVFHEEGVGIKSAFVANSYDGIGEDFPEDEIRWWPFGYPTDTPGATQDSEAYPDLPFAKTGFGLSSPVLLLKEGKRTITFTCELSPFKTSTINVNDFPDAVAVFFSGEKEWIEGTILPSDSAIVSGELKLVVELNEGLDPVIGYNKEVLLEPYDTADPVVRFVIKNSTTDDKGHRFQQLFSNTVVDNITINVSIDAIQDITVENDLGVLDASKPFYPFGPQPKKGSNFFIGLPEALDKNWTKINIDFDWKDKPNLEDNYTAYRTEFVKSISKDRYTLTLNENGAIGNPKNLVPIVDNENHFTAEVQVLDNGVWDSKDLNHLLFSAANRDTSSIEITKTATTKPGNKDFFDFSVKPFGQFKPFSPFSQFGRDSFVSQTKQPPKEKFTAAVKKGFVKLILNQSFLHDLFPRIFSVALSKENVSNTLIPNAPYTPQIETIKVGYDAQASTEDNNVKLFHEHPFGVSEEDKELKNTSVLATTNRVIKLLPTYKNGSLFIALENAENLQSVSLLIQTLEGSENPETTNDFIEGEKLEWSILCDNEWLSLNADYILANNTDNFLRSGIVKFSIPKQATQENTKLPSGYFWLKIDNPRDFDTVSQLIDIKSQAVLARFENNENDVSHLQYGIPAGTISKLVERLANVKGATQEYGSFDGKPEETDKEFYRRISERLRHKQRAITIWDYEHLVLQEFPDIYKVNCLNHTSLTSFLSPGDVTLVVIPNIINQNVYDPYKPRISKAKRNEIQDFINQLNTLHVSAQVINPIYKEVKVILKAKFYEGKDENFYSTQLQKDIAKLLAPWAFEETSIIDFGITLHESMVINYIEKLEYVDYIADFQLQQETGVTNTGIKIFSSVKKVIPSSAKVILTSVKFTNHIIDVVTADEGCTVLTSGE
ncbi:baseplate J/gp47 family protein [Aquimarina sp. 2201CG14-23]|uniref:baseplate J/gp47 family protein n=1 Tax=Aquimarina mycalae TaxID=3040073 RepID=UPI002477CD42|nr:baseplate J/gp47 family protein [Aquimarina sp. 2201CG14-23]MDH7444137.1 baseplate J/gp47 family protein [Aquimarina sp. 2201CG14-23]